MAALAVRDGWVPGTANLVAPEPEHRRPPARPPARRPGRHATTASCRRRSASAASTRRSSSGPSTGDDPGGEPRRATLAAMTDMPTWERRFRAPILAFPSWAADAPDRLVMASTESGSYQLHTWDRRDRRAAPGDRATRSACSRAGRRATGPASSGSTTRRARSPAATSSRRSTSGRRAGAADRGPARAAGPRGWRSAGRARSPASAPRRGSRSGRRSAAASRGGSTSTPSPCGSPAAGA